MSNEQMREALKSARQWIVNGSAPIGWNIDRIDAALAQPKQRGEVVALGMLGLDAGRTYVRECIKPWEGPNARYPHALYTAPPAQPEQRGEVVALKGFGRITGDGWKDTTQVGQVVFVWNAELPEPYASGQFPRIGNPIWSASRDQYDFEPASPEELRQFVEARIKSAAPPAPAVPDGWLQKLAALRARVEDIAWHLAKLADALGENGTVSSHYVAGTATQLRHALDAAIDEGMLAAAGAAQ